MPESPTRSHRMLLRRSRLHSFASGGRRCRFPHAVYRKSAASRPPDLADDEPPRFCPVKVSAAAGADAPLTGQVRGGRLPGDRMVGTLGEALRGRMAAGRSDLAVRDVIIDAAPAGA